MKNFLLVIIFSFPETCILTDRIILRQKLVHFPINLPPVNTKFCGKKSVGKNIIDIQIMPKKKIVENKIFFNIIKKCYINSEIFCLLLSI